MRNLLLLLLIIWLLISALLGGEVVIIQLEIQPELLPYYDWLRSFPSLRQTADNLQPEQRFPYPSRSL